MNIRQSLRSIGPVFFAWIAICPSAVFACDPCSLYNSSRLQGLVPGTFSVSVSEQNTSFDRPENTPPNTPKDGEIVRQFSTTQFSAAYDLDQEFGFQITLPMIVRRIDQFKDYRYDTKSDLGLGDMSIVGRYSPLNYRKDEWSVIGGFTYGIKLPTGDTGTLKEVSNEIGGKPHSAPLLRHHSIASASGGRALTFGTGSIDYYLGANLFTRYQRMMFLSDFQYAFRTEGDFDYKFADDMVWSVGPGYYALLDHQDSLAVRVALTGEFKGADRLAGEKVSGSKISNLYMGPEVLFTIANSVSGQVGVDMRVTGEDPNSTVVPEMRVRAAVAYRFL